jgi:ABC-type multidrug transport system fused ATPase/permease subunit
MMKKLSEPLIYDLKVAAYFLSLSNKIVKSYIPLTLTLSFTSALAPLINIIMTKFIIDELMGEQRIGIFVSYVSFTVVVNALCSLANRYLETKVNIANLKIVNGFELHIGTHMMNMDYERLEDSKILDLKERALVPIKQQGVITKLISSLRAIAQNTISIAGLIAIISSINIFILLIILGIVWINSIVFKKSQKAQYHYHNMLAPINRKFGYYSKLSTDFSMAKDVRIYNMAPLILRKIREYHKESTTAFGKMFGAMGFYNGLTNINVQIQLVVVYSYMVYKVYTKSITIGSFTMFIAAVNSFSSSISSLLNAFVEFRQMCKYLDLYREFEQIPSKAETGVLLVNRTQDTVIEFEDVYFKYPGSIQYSLKAVSIKIQTGEKISIVGRNGAGKSTFIKLLCRLYEPTSGKILLNGVDIREYKYEEYMKLLSVVFQDYKLFHLSVKENIAFGQATNGVDAQLLVALQKSGLLGKVKSLEKGADTVLSKVFDEAGIELSGGESQKLAMARAFYKNAPIIILDEPTAALDPYAEYELYSQFNEIVSEKTAIYISHRLSSCRFCDKVAVFEDGGIVEYAHHDELIRKHETYAVMWEAQAKYYTA